MSNLAILDVIDILEIVRHTRSTKKKIAILENSKDITYLYDVLKYAYDTITYTYGVTSGSILIYKKNLTIVDRPTNIFTVLDNLNQRKYTGYAALTYCQKFIKNCPSEKELFLGIIDRDLKLGLNIKSLSKIWGDISPVPKYNRCSVFSDKAVRKIAFPAYLQLKCDGTYREAHVHNGSVIFRTRAGEPYKNQFLEDQLADLPNGYYLGELTIGKADEPEANRSIGNGEINSNNPPLNKIHFTMWDYISDEEYVNPGSIPYEMRFQQLLKAYEHHDRQFSLLDIVPTYDVADLNEALALTYHFMDKGLEGAVLKDRHMFFKNGTSNLQLKIKLRVDCEMRITGFTEGTGKREGKVGAINFSNDDGTIKGKCSGFTDSQMNDFTRNQDKYIGKIITVEFNSLSKPDGHDYYALVHPRLLEVRKDKNETDSLNKVLRLIDMAKALE